MLRHHHIFLLLLSVLTMLSCGEQHNAQKTIENFLEEYSNATSVSVQGITQLDSTRHVTDSVVMALQQQAANSPQFKRDVTFGSRAPKTKTLMLTKVTYSTTDEKGNMKEHKKTFYLTPDLKEVVALKEN